MPPRLPIRALGRTPLRQLSSTPSFHARRWDPKDIPKIVMSDSVLHLTYPDGHQGSLEHERLYDHCRCERCYHPITKQRLKPLSAMPKELYHVPFGDLVATRTGVSITWEDGHQTAFPYSFLRRLSEPHVHEEGKQFVTPIARQQVLSSLRSEWTSAIASNPPAVEYADLMPSARGDGEEGVLKWLDKVHEYGFCFVHGVPVSPEATEELIRRISHIRETHYGGFYDFTSTMTHGDLAYSSAALPAHTDTTYFTDPAGLQIFHLLLPAPSGGHTLLVDSFRAASALREQSKAHYHTLSTFPVPAHASGTKGSVLRPLAARPVLNHDEHGRLVQVRWNNEDRGVLSGQWETVGRWYEAARAFDELVRGREAEYWVPMQQGTMLVIDNWRVMHGRSAFSGDRRMCGAYIGADDWRSRRRALAQRFRPEEEDKWDVGW